MVEVVSAERRAAPRGSGSRGSGCSRPPWLRGRLPAGWARSPSALWPRQLDAKPMSVYYHVANKGRDPRRLGRHRLQRDPSCRSPGGDWRAGDAHAGPTRHATVLAHDTAGPSVCWSRVSLPVRPTSATTTPSSRRSRQAGFSGRDDRPCVRAARQLRLRFRAPGGRPPVRRTGQRRRGRGADHGADDVRASTPHLVHMATSYYLQPGYDFADEFTFGLELVLDGIERRLGGRPST